MSGEEIVMTGSIEFIWDSGDDAEHMLINVDPDQPECPNTFEVVGNLRDQIVDDLSEGTRIELRYKHVEYEVVDPESATTLDSVRNQIVSIKVL